MVNLGFKSYMLETANCKIQDFEMVVRNTEWHHSSYVHLSMSMAWTN